MTSPLPEYIKISWRSWKDFNIDNFKHKLQDSELCYRTTADRTATEGEESIDMLVERFNTVMFNLLDKTALVSEMTVREWHHQPWFDAESRRIWCVVQLEHWFKTKRLAVAHSPWRTTLRSSRKPIICQAVAYSKAKISSAGNDARGAWTVNSLLGEEKDKICFVIFGIRLFWFNWYENCRY